MTRALGLDLKWAEHAACVGTPMSWWFPENESGHPVPDHVPAAAAERCAGCPVRRECMGHAVAHELFGVWAGLSEEARVRLRRSAGLRLRDEIDGGAA